MSFRSELSNKTSPLSFGLHLFAALVLLVIAIYILWGNLYSVFTTKKSIISTSTSSVATSTLSTATATAQQTGATTQLANPASVNCLKLGGTLSIETRGDGGQYGLCHFEDNRACEEWALLRGDCPYGGRKTTGYDTVDQNYCAWSGGETFAVPDSICAFKDGSKCSTLDFYNGKCGSGIIGK